MNYPVDVAWKLACNVNRGVVIGLFENEFQYGNISDGERYMLSQALRYRQEANSAWFEGAPIVDTEVVTNNRVSQWEGGRAGNCIGEQRVPWKDSEIWVFNK